MEIKDGPDNIIGVCCDICHGRLLELFTYMSMDIRSSRAISDADLALSVDICQGCFDEIKRQVVANYRPSNTQPNCDLCSGNTGPTYYKAGVDKVSVDFKSAAAMCGQCRKKAVGAGACRCGSTHFIKVPLQSVDRDILQIVVCGGCFGKMQSAVMKVRTNG